MYKSRKPANFHRKIKHDLLELDSCQPKPKKRKKQKNWPANWFFPHRKLADQLSQTKIGWFFLHQQIVGWNIKTWDETSTCPSTCPSTQKLGLKLPRWCNHHPKSSQFIHALRLNQPSPPPAVPPPPAGSHFNHLPQRSRMGPMAPLYTQIWWDRPWSSILRSTS